LASIPLGRWLQCEDAAMLDDLVDQRLGLALLS